MTITHTELDRRRPSTESTRSACRRPATRGLSCLAGAFLLLVTPLAPARSETAGCVLGSLALPQGAAVTFQIAGTAPGIAFRCDGPGQLTVVTGGGRTDAALPADAAADVRRVQAFLRSEGHESGTCDSDGQCSGAMTPATRAQLIAYVAGNLANFTEADRWLWGIQPDTTPDAFKRSAQELSDLRLVAYFIASFDPPNP